MEELIPIGSIEGTRVSGRKRRKQIDNIRDWLQLDKSCGLIERAMGVHDHPSYAAWQLKKKKNVISLLSYMSSQNLTSTCL